METSLGKRIAALRRKLDLKQEDLADRLGVSPQAVSKWENDQTCPDITLLPDLAKLLGVSVDSLLSGNDDTAPAVRILPADQRKNIDDMILRIEVDSSDGDRVRVNLPMGIVQIGLEMAVPPMISGDAFKNIDIKQLLEKAVLLVQRGVVGNLIDVTSSDGDTVKIFVE